MSTYSAGLLNVGTLTANGSSAALSANTVTATTLNTTNVNATNFVTGNNLNVGGNLKVAGNAFSGVETPAISTTQAAKITALGNTMTTGGLFGSVSTTNTGCPNLVVSYGNLAETGITTQSFGVQSNGSAPPTDPYIRMASMTKLIGAMICGKMMSEGYFTVDTPVDNFLGSGTDVIRDVSGVVISHPWLLNNRTFIDGSGGLYNYSGTGTGVVGNFQNFYNLSVPDASGQVYNPAASPASITVRHLLNMTAGLSYDWWQLGKYETGSNGLLPNFDLATQARLKYFGPISGSSIIGSGQLGPSASLSSPTPTNQLNNFNMDYYVSQLSCCPLVNLPGTFCEYGMEYDVLGFFMDQVVKQTPALLAAHSNILGYLQNTLYTPLGIPSTSTWFNGGQQAPPVDASSNLLSAWSVRYAGQPYGVMDTSLNYIYDSGGAAIAWMDNVPLDSNAILANNYTLLPLDTSLLHVGNLGSGAVMKLSDYSKIMRLYGNKGWDVVSKTRIISKTAINYLQQPLVSGSTVLNLVGDIYHQTKEQPATGSPYVWSAGGMKGVDCWPLVYTPPHGLIQSFPFPQSKNGFQWIGAYGTCWYIDTDTGAYGCWGFQAINWSNKSTVSSISSSTAVKSGANMLKNILCSTLV